MIAWLLFFFLSPAVLQCQSILSEDYDQAYARCSGQLTSCQIDKLSLYSRHGSIQFVGALSFIGSSSASTVDLYNSFPLVLIAGKLSFVGTSVYGATFALNPPVPQRDISLLGMQIVAGAQLVIANSSIYLDCSGWSSLFDVLCDHGLAPGNVKVRK